MLRIANQVDVIAAGIDQALFGKYAWLNEAGQDDDGQMVVGVEHVTDARLPYQFLEDAKVNALFVLRQDMQAAIGLEVAIELYHAR